MIGFSVASPAGYFFFVSLITTVSFA